MTQISASQIRVSQIRATEISSNHHELHGTIFVFLTVVQRKAWIAMGWVATTPILVWYSNKNWTIDCLRQEKVSHSTNFWARSAWSTILKERGKPQGVMWPPHGGGMQAKANKIVILCYFPSIFYQINCCKNIQNIKNYQVLPTPPTGEECCVTHQL